MRCPGVGEGIEPSTAGRLCHLVASMGPTNQAPDRPCRATFAVGVFAEILARRARSSLEQPSRCALPVHWPQDQVGGRERSWEDSGRARHVRARVAGGDTGGGEARSRGRYLLSTGGSGRSARDVEQQHAGEINAQVQRHQAAVAARPNTLVIRTLLGIGRSGLRNPSRETG